MNRGIIVIAHNNRKVDYAKTAIVAAKFAKKNLCVPVSLITDESTVEWMKSQGDYDYAERLFDKIISVDRPLTDNERIIHDGSEQEKVPFINSNRSKVWDLTPYDRTLLIDSDFLIMTDELSNYWDSQSDLLIGHSFNDIQGTRKGYLDTWVSETGIHLYWATTVMFTKNEMTKVFFGLVDYIRENYKYYADLFRFDPRQYRNDISFSIAKHILDGFGTTGLSLPPIFTVQDKDVLEDIKDDSSMIFSVKSFEGLENFIAASVKNRDVHIMNKQSIVRNYQRLRDL
jgi:hypothetical protein